MADDLQLHGRGWTVGFATAGDHPEYDQVLEGRASTNFLVARDGTIIHSTMEPQVLAEVLGACSASDGTLQEGAGEHVDGVGPYRRRSDATQR